MQAEKQIIIDEILERINASPFMLVTDYTGMNVPQFAELRNRLRAVGSSYQVAKNTFVKRAAETAEYPGSVADFLGGQTAIVTGESDVCAASKVLKNFRKEFEKPEIKGGVLDGELLDTAQIDELASLPPMEVLQAQLLGMLNTPAQQLVTVLNEPGSALARLFQAKHDQGE
jgi:large subunit ribosomal protein L10